MTYPSVPGGRTRGRARPWSTPRPLGVPCIRAPAAGSRCGEPPPPPPDLGLARVTRFGQWDVSPRETRDGLQRACTAGFVSGTPVRRAHPGDPTANPRRSSTLREQNRTQPGPADPGVHEPRTMLGVVGRWAGPVCRAALLWQQLTETNSDSSFLECGSLHPWAHYTWAPGAIG